MPGEQGEAPHRLSGAIDHVGLTVEHLDAEASFYGRAFAFSPEFEFDLPGGICGVMLIAPGGQRLELFQPPDSLPGINAATPIEAFATRGYGHFALSAPDIEPLYEQALAAGARSVLSPRPSPEPGVRFAFVADVEGNLVELVERR